MNLDEFSYVADDRRYINPQVGLDESNAFIDNLRNTQAQRTEEIAQDTYNLGTAIPSNLGGLGGAGSYFTARYQTPQTNAIIGDLKATAQAQALSEAMNNELAKAKQRYTNAYKSYQKRYGGTGGGGGSSEGVTADGEVDYVSDDGTAPENPGNPSASDYVEGGYTFSNKSDLPGQTGKYPLTVDTPTYSTSFYDKRTNDAFKDAQNWVDYLHSIGWRG